MHEFNRVISRELKRLTKFIHHLCISVTLWFSKWRKCPLTQARGPRSENLEFPVILEHHLRHHIRFDLSALISENKIFTK